MKTIVIYESYFGNTKLIAEAVAKELGAKAIFVSQFEKEDIVDLGLLIVGSPIRGWQPTEGIMAFLNSLESGILKNVKVTTFDTRVKLFIHGDAKEKMAKALKAAGAEIASKPMAFYVKGTEGPLFDGEIEKAKSWAKEIRNKL